MVDTLLINASVVLAIVNERKTKWVLKRLLADRCTVDIIILQYLELM